jgi:hypothetical protein
LEESDKRENNRSLIYKTMAVSFIGSGLAEFLSLAFYYPFDLIKTRMQVANNLASSSLSQHHRYNGVLDATLKIISESDGKAPNAERTSFQKLRDRLVSFKNLYKGGFVFGMSYTAYMAVQFSLFESILLYLEKR